MLAPPRQPPITDETKATSAAVQAMPRSAQPNQHFAWLCVDANLSRLVVAFRGTEYFKDWLEDFDFAPPPYHSIPGRGTLPQGLHIPSEAVRATFPPSRQDDRLLSGHRRLERGPSASRRPTCLDGRLNCVAHNKIVLCLGRSVHAQFRFCVVNVGMSRAA